jgi:hypothetical protein
MDSGVQGDGSQSPCSEMENYHRRSLTVAFYNLDESHSFQMFECPEFIVMTKPQLSKNLVSQRYWTGFVIARQSIPLPVKFSLDSNSRDSNFPRQLQLIFVIEFAPQAFWLPRLFTVTNRRLPGFLPPAHFVFRILKIGRVKWIERIY